MFLGVFMSYYLPSKAFYLSLSCLGCPGYCRPRRAIRTVQPELGLRDTGKKQETKGEKQESKEFFSRISQAKFPVEQFVLVSLIYSSQDILEPILEFEANLHKNRVLAKWPCHKV